MNSIPAKDWNRLIDDLARNQIIGATVLSRGDWRHPWSVSVEWTGGRFDAKIKPGFVNGLDPEMEVEGQDAPETTLKRLGHTQISARGIKLDAILTEEPSLPLTLWRQVGYDAKSVDDEMIPEYLIAQGASPKAPTSTGFERLLRATEIVLFKDRIATNTNWTFGLGLDGTAAQFDVFYAARQNARQRAYIRTERKTAPLAPTDELAKLFGGYQDSGLDRLALATVFLLSPPGAYKDSEPDGEWTPYVQHHLFWNLTHDVNVQARESLNDSLALPTGLGLGVADVTINNLAAWINDTNDALSEFLRNNEAEGRFWSV